MGCCTSDQSEQSYSWEAQWRIQKVALKPVASMTKEGEEAQVKVEETLTAESKEETKEDNKEEIKEPMIEVETIDE